MAGGKSARKAAKQPQQAEKPKSAEQSVPTELEKLRLWFNEYKQKNRRNAEKQVSQLFEKQPTPLVRLCRAKMWYHQFMEDRDSDRLSPSDKLKLLADIVQALKPIVEGQEKKSLLGCCLLVCALQEQGRLKPAQEEPSAFQDLIDLYENTIDKHKSGADWVDPKEEQLDLKSNHDYDKVEGDGPEMRKVDKLRYLRGLRKDFDEQRLVRRKDNLSVLDASSLLFMGIPPKVDQRQRGALAEQEKRKQQKPAVEAENQLEKARHKKQGKGRKEDSKRHVNEETARKIKEFLHQTLPEAGPEGSEERIEALLKLTELSFEEFERKARELVAKQLTLYDAKEVSPQFKRFKQKKSWISYQDLPSGLDQHQRAHSDRKFDSPRDLENHVIDLHIKNANPKAVLDPKSKSPEFPKDFPALSQVWNCDLQEWLAAFPEDLGESSDVARLRPKPRSRAGAAKAKQKGTTQLRCLSDDDVECPYEPMASSSRATSEEGSTHADDAGASSETKTLSPAEALELKLNRVVFAEKEPTSNVLDAYLEHLPRLESYAFEGTKGASEGHLLKVSGSDFVEHDMLLSLLQTREALEERQNSMSNEVNKLLAMLRGFGLLLYKKGFLPELEDLDGHRALLQILLNTSEVDATVLQDLSNREEHRLFYHEVLGLNPPGVLEKCLGPDTTPDQSAPAAPLDSVAGPSRLPDPAVLADSDTVPADKPSAPAPTRDPSPTGSALSARSHRDQQGWVLAEPPCGEPTDPPLEFPLLEVKVDTPASSIPQDPPQGCTSAGLDTPGPTSSMSPISQQSAASASPKEELTSLTEGQRSNIAESVGQQHASSLQDEQSNSPRLVNSLEDDQSSSRNIGAPLSGGSPTKQQSTLSNSQPCLSEQSNGQQSPNQHSNGEASVPFTSEAGTWDLPGGAEADAEGNTPLVPQKSPHELHITPVPDSEEELRHGQDSLHLPTGKPTGPRTVSPEARSSRPANCTDLSPSLNLTGAKAARPRSVIPDGTSPKTAALDATDLKPSSPKATSPRAVSPQVVSPTATSPGCSSLVATSPKASSPKPADRNDQALQPSSAAPVNNAVDDTDKQHSSTVILPQSSDDVGSDAEMHSLPDNDDVEMGELASDLDFEQVCELDIQQGRGFDVEKGGVHFSGLKVNSQHDGQSLAQSSGGHCATTLADRDSDSDVDMPNGLLAGACPLGGQHNIEEDIELMPLLGHSSGIEPDVKAESKQHGRAGSADNDLKDTILQDRFDKDAAKGDESDDAVEIGDVVDIVEEAPVSRLAHEPGSALTVVDKDWPASVSKADVSAKDQSSWKGSDDSFDLRPQYKRSNGGGWPAATRFQQVEEEADASAGEDDHEMRASLLEDVMLLIDILRESAMLTHSLLHTMRVYVWCSLPPQHGRALSEVDMLQRDDPCWSVTPLTALRDMRRFLLEIIGQRWTSTSLYLHYQHQRCEAMQDTQYATFERPKDGSFPTVMRLSKAGFAVYCQYVNEVTTRAQEAAENSAQNSGAQLPALPAPGDIPPDASVGELALSKSPATASTQPHIATGTMKEVAGGEDIERGTVTGLEATADTAARQAAAGGITNEGQAGGCSVCSLCSGKPLKPRFLPGTVEGEDALVDYLFGLLPPEECLEPDMLHQDVTWAKVLYHVSRAAHVAALRKQLQVVYQRLLRIQGGIMPDVDVRGNMLQNNSLLDWAPPEEVMEPWKDAVYELRRTMLQVEVAHFEHLHQTHLDQLGDLHAQKKSYEQELQDLENKEKQDSKRNKHLASAAHVRNFHRQQCEENIKQLDEQIAEANQTVNHIKRRLEQFKKDFANLPKNRPNILESSKIQKMLPNKDHILVLTSREQPHWPRFLRDSLELMRNTVQKIWELDVMFDAVLMRGRGIFSELVQLTCEWGPVAMACQEVWKTQLEASAKEAQARAALKDLAELDKVNAQQRQDAKLEQTTGKKKKKKTKNSSKGKAAAKGVGTDKAVDTAADDDEADKEEGEACLGEGADGSAKVEITPDIAVAVNAVAQSKDGGCNSQAEPVAKQVFCEDDYKQLIIEDLPRVVDIDDDPHSIQAQRQKAQELGLDLDDSNWDGLPSGPGIQVANGAMTKAQHSASDKKAPSKQSAPPDTILDETPAAVRLAAANLPKALPMDRVYGARNDNAWVMSSRGQQPRSRHGDLSSSAAEASRSGVQPSHNLPESSRPSGVSDRNGSGPSSTPRSFVSQHHGHMPTPSSTSESLAVRGRNNDSNQGRTSTSNLGAGSSHGSMNHANASGPQQRSWGRAGPQASTSYPDQRNGPQDSRAAQQQPSSSNCDQRSGLHEASAILQSGSISKFDQRPVFSDTRGTQQQLSTPSYDKRSAPSDLRNAQQASVPNYDQRSAVGDGRAGQHASSYDHRHSGFEGRNGALTEAASIPIHDRRGHHSQHTQPQSHHQGPGADQDSSWHQRRPHNNNSTAAHNNSPRIHNNSSMHTSSSGSHNSMHGGNNNVWDRGASTGPRDDRGHDIQGGRNNQQKMRRQRREKERERDRERERAAEGEGESGTSSNQHHSQPQSQNSGQGQGDGAWRSNRRSSFDSEHGHKGWDRQGGGRRRGHRGEGANGPRGRADDERSDNGDFRVGSGGRREHLGGTSKESMLGRKPPMQQEHSGPTSNLANNCVTEQQNTVMGFSPPPPPPPPRSAGPSGNAPLGSTPQEQVAGGNTVATASRHQPPMQPMPVSQSALTAALHPASEPPALSPTLQLPAPIQVLPNQHHPPPNQAPQLVQPHNIHLGHSLQFQAFQHPNQGSMQQLNQHIQHPGPLLPMQHATTVQQAAHAVAPQHAQHAAPTQHAQHAAPPQHVQHAPQHAQHATAPQHTAASQHTLAAPHQHAQHPVASPPQHPQHPQHAAAPQLHQQQSVSVPTQPPHTHPPHTHPAQHPNAPTLLTHHSSFPQQHTHHMQLSNQHAMQNALSIHNMPALSGQFALSHNAFPFDGSYVMANPNHALPDATPSNALYAAAVANSLPNAAAVAAATFMPNTSSAVLGATPPVSQVASNFPFQQHAPGAMHLQSSHLAPFPPYLAPFNLQTPPISPQLNAAPLHSTSQHGMAQQQGVASQPLLPSVSQLGLANQIGVGNQLAANQLGHGQLEVQLPFVQGMHQAAVPSRLGLHTSESDMLWPHLQGHDPHASSHSRPSVASPPLSQLAAVPHAMNIAPEEEEADNSELLSLLGVGKGLKQEADTVSATTVASSVALSPAANAAPPQHTIQPQQDVQSDHHSVHLERHISIEQCLLPLPPSLHAPKSPVPAHDSQVSEPQPCSGTAPTAKPSWAEMFKKNLPRTDPAPTSAPALPPASLIPPTSLASLAQPPQPLLEPQEAAPSKTAEELQEEEDMRIAIMNSLAESRRPAFHETSSSSPTSTSYHAATSNGTSVQVSGAGLRNLTGEYNCFLNVIIQCLWHCQGLRDQMLLWQEPLYNGHAVVAALVHLFHDLRSAESDVKAGLPHRVVDPTALREALDQLGTGFSLGEMNDAAEVLSSIFQCMGAVRNPQAPSSSLALVDEVFGLELSEQVQCRHCRAVTHVVDTHTEYFYIVSATSLRSLLAASEGEAPMNTGQLLHELDMQHQKSCDRDKGGCGQLNVPRKQLQRLPQVFTIQLAWETAGVSIDDIRATMEGVQEHIDLGQVFSSNSSDIYRLESMVCYYGQHYQALIYNHESSEWLLFDDASISRVGTWAELITKCQAGRIQPSVLFYCCVGTGLALPNKEAGGANGIGPAGYEAMRSLHHRSMERNFSAQ